MLSDFVSLKGTSELCSVVPVKSPTSRTEKGAVNGETPSTISQVATNFANELGRLLPDNGCKLVAGRSKVKVRLRPLTRRRNVALQAQVHGELTVEIPRVPDHERVNARP